MKILVNHISLNELIEKFDQINFNEIIINLAKCLKIIMLNKHPNEIYLTGNFDGIFDIVLPRNTSFRDAMRTCQDQEAKGIVLSKLSNYTKIDDFIENTIPYSISLFTNECWKEINTPLADLSIYIKEIKNIPCLSSGSLSDIIKRAVILLELTVVSKDGILNSCYSDILYTEEFENNFIQLMRSSDEEKHSVIKDISELICSLNGFIKDSKVSTRNKRDIYYNQDKEIYLSTDYLHGTFEVHDENGSHQGEINFKGKLLEEKDKSKRHDIFLK